MVIDYVMVLVAPVSISAIWGKLLTVVTFSNIFYWEIKVFISLNISQIMLSTTLHLNLKNICTSYNLDRFLSIFTPKRLVHSHDTVMFRSKLLLLREEIVALISSPSDDEIVNLSIPMRLKPLESLLEYKATFYKP